MSELTISEYVKTILGQENKMLEVMIAHAVQSGFPVTALSLIRKLEADGVRFYLDVYPEGQSESDKAKILELKSALSARDATIADQAAEIERSQGQRDAARQTVDKIREEAQKELADKEKTITAFELQCSAQVEELLRIEKSLAAKDKRIEELCKRLHFYVESAEAWRMDDLITDAQITEEEIHKDRELLHPNPLGAK